MTRLFNESGVVVMELHYFTIWVALPIAVEGASVRSAVKCRSRISAMSNPYPNNSSALEKRCRVRRNRWGMRMDAVEHAHLGQLESMSRYVMQRQYRRGSPTCQQHVYTQKIDSELGAPDASRSRTAMGMNCLENALIKEKTAMVHVKHG
jgi:hypothetical protein